VIALDIDTSEAERKAKEAVRLIREKNRKAGILAARVHAYHQFQYTMPASSQGDGWRFKEMAKRIKGDVERTHGVRWEEGWQWKAYQVLQDEKDERIAKNFWSKYMADTERASRLREKTGLDHKEYFERQRVRKVPAADKYLAYRKANGYKIPRKPRILGLVDREKRDKLVQSRQKTMGLAKAGWFAAAKHLKGGYKVTRGADTNRRVFPKQVGLPFRIFGGMSLGKAKVVAGRNGYSYVVRNKVRYANDEHVTPEWGRDKAVALTKRYMMIQFERTMKHGKLWRDAKMAKAA